MASEATIMAVPGNMHVDAMVIGREFCKIKTSSENVQQANSARADRPENFRVRRGRRLEARGPLALWGNKNRPPSMKVKKVE